ncbi:MAG: ABC transporter substrate-binding protein, partial [Halanaerobiales bacterium]
GVDELLEDPIAKKIFEVVSEADHMQLWSDSYLPRELATVQKNTVQALMGLEMSPEEAADKMEEAAEDYFEDN